MREHLKDGLHQTLLDLGIASLARRWHSGSGVILAYHNIIPRGEKVAGEMSLHLEQDKFGRQLDLLSETHELVALNELFGATRSERPRAAITFDDGYRGALSAGLAELRSRDIPATYFITPGLLGETTFWWDAIAAAHSGIVPDDIRDTALSDGKGRQDRILGWAEAEGILTGSVPDHCRPALPAEVHRASTESGITIGSHTWSHPNLSQLGSATVASELRRSRQWIIDKTDSPVPWLAYPYGILPNDSFDHLFDDGEYAVTTKAELVDLDSPPSHRLTIPRMNVSSAITLRRFELLTSGL